MSEDEQKESTGLRKGAEMLFEERAKGGTKESPTEALSRFGSRLLDLTIPGGMKGKEAIRRLRHPDPDVKAPFLSDYSDDTVVSQVGDYGFRDALQKPCSSEELTATLSRVLRDSAD